MIYVIASIQVKEGRKSDFIELFKSNIPNVAAEKGCIEYAPTVDLPSGLAPQELNDNVVTIMEKWDSLEDLQAHMSSPHMMAFQEKEKDLVDGVSLKILKEA